MQFWLVWAVVSSVVAGLGYVLGVVAALPIAVIASVLPGASFIAFPVAASAVGLVIGVLVGLVQSILLPPAWGVGNRWIRRSAVGWAAGAALGSIIALALDWALFGVGGRGVTPDYSTYVLEMATPVSGLVLGWALCPVLPGAPVRLPWWLAAHALAVSGGWIGSRLLIGSPDFGSLWGLALGALCYGVVSATAMLVVVRSREAAPVEQHAD